MTVDYEYYACNYRSREYSRCQYIKYDLFDTSGAQKTDDQYSLLRSTKFGGDNKNSISVGLGRSGFHWGLYSTSSPSSSSSASIAAVPLTLTLLLTILVGAGGVGVGGRGRGELVTASCSSTRVTRDIHLLLVRKLDERVALLVRLGCLLVRLRLGWFLCGD